LRHGAVEALELNQESTIVHDGDAHVPFVFCRFHLARRNDFSRIPERQTHFVAHWFSFFALP
jgi:hypothetical protein